MTIFDLEVARCCSTREQVVRDQTSGNETA